MEAGNGKDMEYQLTRQVFDLRQPGPNEDRLERIEAMLARLLHEPVTPRASHDTMVGQAVPEAKTMTAAPTPTYR